MLFAYVLPQYVVISEAAPVFRHLGRPPERYSVKRLKDLERDLSRKYVERVKSDEVLQLFCEKRKLREATHCENAVKDQLSLRVG